MKSPEPQLFKYQLEYVPYYKRVGKIKPYGRFDDIVDFLGEIERFFKGKSCKYAKYSPMYVAVRTDKDDYQGLIIKFKGEKTSKPDIEFFAVYYDYRNKKTDPRSFSLNDKTSTRDDFAFCYRLLQSLTGHYYYINKQLEKGGYKINANIRHRTNRMDLDKTELALRNRGRRGSINKEIPITRHDLLNEYIKTKEEGYAYNRIEQRDMVRMIQKRFKICQGISDKKIISRPHYYLEKCFEYTDFKLAPVASTEYNAMSVYFGIRLIVPKEDDEKKNFFDDYEKKLKLAVYGK